MQLLSHSYFEFWIPDESKIIFQNLERSVNKFFLILIINFFDIILAVFIYLYHEILQVDEDKILAFQKI